jgi:hypothetical protein
MKRIFLTGYLAMAVLSAARAQAPEVPESLSAWQYFKELRISIARTGLLAVVLDRDILDRARRDQADLRLYTSAGREIPYVLRIRREVETANQAACREFNRGVEGGVAVVSCDLGERPPEHNMVGMSRAAPMAPLGPRWLPRPSSSASPPPAAPSSSRTCRIP